MVKKASLWTARFLLFGTIIYNAWLCYETKNIVNKISKIQYEFIGTKVIRGGRGNSYQMKVFYNKKEYKVSITSKMYLEIDKGVLPELYYTNFGGFVFSNWEIKLRFRLSLLAMVGFGCTFIPIGKIEKKLRG